MATYKQIQEYVQSKNKVKPKSCGIAHMKEVCGIPVHVSSNRCNSDKSKVLCLENKKAVIINSFKHFGMI